MSRAQEASLTVFRHFDSATVVKGLVGRAPKTAWVVGYPLLERIHYLLVAGLDVFGNVGHQLTTRLYMDFLRMEGEADFLMFLPPARRRELTDSWYRGVDGAPKATIANELAGWVAVPGSSIGLRCWHGLAVLPPFDALFRCLAKCERAACPSDSRTNA